MADADLDALIRKLSKQQHQTLTLAVKKQKDRYAALAAKAKDIDSKKLYRQLAKEAHEIGTATVRRLQMSADNAAHSYARLIRQAVEAAKTRQPTAKKAAAKGPKAKTSSNP